MFKKYLIASFITLSFCLGLFLVTDFVLASGAIDSLANPLNPTEDKTTAKWIPFAALTGGVIKWIFGLLGIVALIVFIIGGFYYLTAAGNPEKFKKGTDTLVYAVIGLIVSFSSYFILDFIVKNLAIK